MLAGKHFQQLNQRKMRQPRLLKGEVLGPWFSNRISIPPIESKKDRHTNTIEDGTLSDSITE